MINIVSQTSSIKQEICHFHVDAQTCPVAICYESASQRRRMNGSESLRSGLIVKRVFNLDILYHKTML